MAGFLLGGRRTRVFGLSIKNDDGGAAREPRRRRPATDMNFWKGLLKQIAKCSLPVYSRDEEKPDGGGWMLNCEASRLQLPLLHTFRDASRSKNEFYAVARRPGLGRHFLDCTARVEIESKNDATRYNRVCFFIHSHVDLEAREINGKVVGTTVTAPLRARDAQWR